MTTHAKLDVPSLGTVELPTGLFINNEWRPSSSGQTFQTINPATGKPLLEFSQASKEDVDEAVKAARHAFNTVWGNNIAADKRGALLYKLADLIERDADRLAALESIDSGKGIRMARDFDVAETAICLRYYAGLADKFFGQTIPHYGKEKFVYTVHQPIGVCGQIIPWNYPIQMWSWKIGPALAAGCTVIMKPSELTPITANVLCDLIKEAGFPPGVVNTVHGTGAITGEAISRHMGVDKIAFTGSVATGRRISIAAAESNLKKVTLELGGKTALLVFDSADVEDAAAWTAMGIWFNSGQDCVANSRVYVQEGIYEKFLEALKQKAETAAIGQPEDEKTSFGPLISQLQRDKVLNYIESGKKDGVRVVTGGNKWKDSGEGYWIEPTILADVTADMKVVKEEASFLITPASLGTADRLNQIFGPVIVAAKFKTEEEAISLANSSIYGLGAGVFTNDARQGTRVTHALDAGAVWLNQSLVTHANAPFGGFKQSGIGRELGTYGLEAYTQVKAVHQNLTMTVDWPL